ncbi:hypothetical protein ILYODFUR_007266 [Ilyodon furcidens]|uniref:DDE-1 domain-containing protein n=1 Tax=Ilyodon furcidens TaxID=33524 RepID=A0ABV0VBW2_9TELE
MCPDHENVVIILVDKTTSHTASESSLLALHRTHGGSNLLFSMVPHNHKEDSSEKGTLLQFSAVHHLNFLQNLFQRYFLKWPFCPKVFITRKQAPTCCQYKTSSALVAL